MNIMLGPLRRFGRLCPREPFQNLLRLFPSKSQMIERKMIFAFPRQRMNSSARNFYRASEPDYLDDGTPKVIIPQHVLLRGLKN